MRRGGVSDRVDVGCIVVIGLCTVLGPTLDRKLIEALKVCYAITEPGNFKISLVEM